MFLLFLISLQLAPSLVDAVYGYGGGGGYGQPHPAAGGYGHPAGWPAPPPMHWGGGGQQWPGTLFY
jgi:hypothetical protein